MDVSTTSIPEETVFEDFVATDNNLRVELMNKQILNVLKVVTDGTKSGRSEVDRNKHEDKVGEQPILTILAVITQLRKQ